MHHICFCSGGKDSTAMIEIMFRVGIKIDEIIFVANEKEFPQEKEFRYFLANRWSSSTKCTIIQTKDKWDNWFYGEITRGPQKGLRRGFPPTLYPCYWTRESKVNAIAKYLKKQKEPVLQYIGYTKNEKSNARQDIKWKYFANEIDNKRFPLIDWGMTEEDCREFCYENGLLNPLYNYFDRLGCYLCPKQSQESLKTLKNHFPDQWNELVRYCEDTYSNSYVLPGQFNIQFSLQDLYYL